MRGARRVGDTGYVRGSLPVPRLSWIPSLALLAPEEAGEREGDW